MARILIWSALGVAVLVIIAVGILALVIRLAMWVRLRASRAGKRDATDEDLERDKAMQIFQRDKARHTGPGPW